jgi:hypothetical protein
VHLMIDAWVIVCKVNNYILHNGVHATFLEIIVVCYPSVIIALFHCSKTLPHIWMYNIDLSEAN